ncbi:hypothetical protein [Methanobrevibacter sp.]|uniref:hypothetical protein n=1 Tax=Methanobrevibacter sp. TaxID=66852 RepID=UPI0038704939
MDSFNIVTLLGAYTHYFLLFSCDLVYLLILAHILKSPDKREKSKHGFIPSFH